MRHDRGGAAVDRGAHLVEAHRICNVLLVGEVDGGPLPFDVRAGAEGLAVPGKDHRARVADVHERIGQLGDQRGVEGVPPLRAPKRHAEDIAVSFHPKRAHVRAA